MVNLHDVKRPTIDNIYVDPRTFDKIINITHDNFTFDFDNRFETINSFNVPILDQEWSEINNNNW